MKLEKLQYQLDAINKVISEIDKNNVLESQNLFANPLWHNPKNIDVKMETGTGKTYVYTRLIHQLKQDFGFFKFIIIVPSLAIKEGIKISISSDEWKRHFRREFNNQTINLNIINAGDFSSKKGKRKQMPESLRSFCESSKAEIQNISVLLLNDAMLASKTMNANDYDSTLFGSISCPIDGLKNTKPIIIIDEPHRFKKEGAAWKNIIEGLNPQAIIRFGAAFPDKTIGSGREKQTIKDYENGKPVYELNAVQSFNDGLVKGVHIIYPALPDNNAELVKYKVKEIEKGKKVVFTKTGSKKEYEIAIGQDLSALDIKFDGGITIENILSSNSAMLSNDLELHRGMDLIPEMYSFSYQEILLKQALKSHFEKEKENFYRQNAGLNLPRIKTNSLFFIDSIASFRGGKDEEKGWLRLKFEELLTKQLKDEIKKADGEYKSFLSASLAAVGKTIAGYFAEDNEAKGDEAIANEVDKVLRDKEQSLKFKNEKGDWNICRFFFSKWTLCEGWDNPNVFVICKLRSSGSEIRKLQEVGRGLRLPFDENGTRVSSQNSNEDFRLSYIIDYCEKDFAQKLCGEINEDGAKIINSKLTDEILEELVKSKYADNKEAAFAKLLIDKIVDVNRNIVDSEKLFTLLPQNLKIKAGKITGLGMPQRPKAHINKENFKKLKTLWEKATKRYVLQFEQLDKNLLEKTLNEVLSQKDIFVLPSVQIVKQAIQIKSAEALAEHLGYNSVESSLSVLSYGEFLKRISKRTSLPIALLNKSIILSRKNLKTSSDFFNIETIEKIIKAFEKKFEEIFVQRWTYQELDYNAKTSLICAGGGIISEFNVELLGNKKSDGNFLKKEKYLYTDNFAAYDSDIELQVLKVEPPDEVIVYGKLPKGSIKVPTYTGGTTSPDFIYAISKNKSKTIELNLIVETKSDNPRLSDITAVNAQEKRFKDIGKDIKWKLVTDIRDFERDLKKLSKNE